MNPAFGDSVVLHGISLPRCQIIYDGGESLPRY